MSETIAEIVERLGLQTDKTTGHSYGPFYDEAFAPYRDRPIRLLEIGVERGDSLSLWGTYFVRGEIVGVDIDTDKVGAAFRCAPVATLVRGDAYTEAMANALGDFDIIIDDGSHTLASQLDLLRLYLPRLNPGGLLVIEDVQFPRWIAELVYAVPDGYQFAHWELTDVKGVSDDRLFVVRRPA